MEKLWKNGKITEWKKYRNIATNSVLEAYVSQIKTLGYCNLSYIDTLNCTEPHKQ